MTAEAQPQLKGGRIARSAVMLCKDSNFRLWLDRRCKAKFQMDIADGTHTEQDAKDFILKWCEIDSRALLDHNKQAGQRYGYMLNHYRKWVANTGRQQ